MAKSKPKGLSNPHLRARVSFLNRAAHYLANPRQAATNADEVDANGQNGNGMNNDKASPNADVVASVEKARQDHSKERQSLGLAQRLASHTKIVAQKSQIRLGRSVKQSVCKVCNTPMIEASTAMSYKSNHSRNASKPWADELRIKCLVCGTVKLYPTGAVRQPRKDKRRDQSHSIQHDDAKSNTEMTRSE